MQKSFKFWFASSVVKHPPAMQRCGFTPWVGKIPWRRKWQPTPIFLPGKFHGQKCLAGYSPWGGRRVGQDLVTKQSILLLLPVLLVPNSMSWSFSFCVFCFIVLGLMLRFFSSFWVNICIWYKIRVLLHSRVGVSSFPNIICWKIVLSHWKTLTLLSKIIWPGTSLVAQWLRLHTPNTGDWGSTPGQGTRSHIPQLKVRVPQLKITHAAEDPSFQVSQLRPSTAK